MKHPLPSGRVISGTTEREMDGYPNIKEHIAEMRTFMKNIQHKTSYEMRLCDYIRYLIAIVEEKIKEEEAKHA